MKTPSLLSSDPIMSIPDSISMALTHEESPSLSLLRRVAAWSNDHDALTALGLVCAWGLGILALTAL